MQPLKANQIDRPALLLSREFDHIEKIAKVMDWRQDFRQLEPGPLEGKLTVVANRQSRLTFIQFGRSCHQLGFPPEGYLTFGLPFVAESGITVGGVDVSPPPLMNFNTDRGLDVINHGRFEGIVVNFDPEFFRNTSKFLGMPDSIFSDIEAHDCFPFEPGASEPLAELVGNIVSSAEDPDEPESLHEYQEAFDFEIAALILELMSKSDTGFRESRSSRHQALKRALKILDSDDCYEITVAKLCESGFSSLSTLHRAFVEEFGVPPKKYIQARRLAGVQQALVNAKPGQTVSELANDWGFWHMGAFASDYKNQFGELPSETLKSAWSG